jgi:hypothetical protein
MRLFDWIGLDWIGANRAAAAATTTTTTTTGDVTMM